MLTVETRLHQVRIGDVVGELLNGGLRLQLRLCGTAIFTIPLPCFEYSQS